LKKQKRKKEKKKKKHKKEKYQHSDNESSHSSSSSYSNKKQAYETSTFIKQKLGETPGKFGLIGKDGEKIKNKSGRYEPDEELFKRRLELKEKEQKLNRKSESSSVKYLSENEKEHRRQEMERKALAFDMEKMKVYSEKRTKTDEKIKNYSHKEKQNVSLLNKPGFLKSIEK